MAPDQITSPVPTGDTALTVSPVFKIPPFTVSNGGDSINTNVDISGTTTTGFGNPLSPTSSIIPTDSQLINTGSKTSVKVLPSPPPPSSSVNQDDSLTVSITKSSRTESLQSPIADTSSSTGNAKQSFHENFFYNLGKWATGIPMQHLWVIVIDFKKIQSSINYWLSSEATEMTPFDSAEREMFASLTSTEYQSKAFEQYSYGCLFARSISIPGEKIEITRAGLEGMSGGMLFPSIISNRTPFPEIGVSFMETNASFVDFVIRPWLVAASHAGTVARTSNNLKTNMTAYFYSKSDTLSDNRPQADTSSLVVDGSSIYSPGAPFILNGQPLNARKIFTFENILPTSVNAQEYTQSGEGLQIRPCNFTYTKYYTTSNNNSSSLLARQPKMLAYI